MQHLATFFKALADPTRLRIVELLMQSSFCVCEMQRILQLPQPLLSRHLAYLRHSGLVKSQRAGVRVNYRLNKTHPFLWRMERVLPELLASNPVENADPGRLRTAF
jgi:ArsR family transcriptional regulator